MARLFKRGRREEDGGESEPENRDGAHLEGYYSRWVPASVRTADAMRIGATLGESEEGDTDSDIEFIASLLEEVERNPAPIQRATRAPQPRIEQIVLPEDPMPRREVRRVETLDELQVFRDTTEESQRKPVSRTVKVPEVDIADLLEALETTAAALRRRRAA